MGGGRGHALRMSDIAEPLLDGGHRVTLVAQRVDLLPAAVAERCTLLPAPLTPRLLAKGSRSYSSRPATLGDILARLGCDDPDIVAAIVRSWRDLLRLAAPDAVIADYAPFLLAAARGRLPSAAVGNAFCTPPGGMDVFPSLAGEAAASDEAQTLESVNAGLRRIGVAPLEALPRLFDADRHLVESFAELDPYARWRSEPLLAPPVPSGPLAGAGDELFVYMPETVGPDAPLWAGLEQARLPVRLFVPKLSDEARRQLASLGFAVESAPLPFARIAAGSRMLIHHGGHGSTVSALLAGLPQVVCHYDLEKALNAAAVTRIAVGGHVPLNDIDPARFSVSLRRLYDDRDLAARARAKAAELRSRCGQDPREIIAAAVEELI